MLVSKAAILAVLLRFPAYFGDVETETERSERLETIASAVHSASSETPWPGDRNELAAALITQAVFETHLARHVHAGRCKQHECDGGRAATLWQLQYGSWLPRKQWLAMQGLELAPTERAARYAAGILSRGRNRCRDLFGALSLYATGRSCSWRGAQERTDFAAKVVSELYREQEALRVLPLEG
jgi:hypothetical protein